MNDDDFPDPLGLTREELILNLMTDPEPLRRRRYPGGQLWDKRVNRQRPTGWYDRPPARRSPRTEWIQRCRRLGVKP
ncbi:hypothetical protein [Amaricoccus sp.]|uniref:hypothetical protein n=1 Tax=Amaricoccus sp. TaxID=1872485 RepID=UPI001B69E836|nr:hypothetical protein [Amaricoccus sp.]MBP7002289.1 hypothetical protein [Amaricoccus sp.]